MFARRRHVRLLVGLSLAAMVAALTVALGSCSTDLPTQASSAVLGGGCSVASDCNSPLVCTFRKCHVECTASRDCPAGQRCVETDKPFRVCQLTEESKCIYTSQCPGSEMCAPDGQCRDACKVDRDCLPGDVCTQAACAAVTELTDGGLAVAEGGTPLGAMCSYASECPAPLVCHEGKCQAACATSFDCGTNATCLGGICVPLVCGQVPGVAPVPSYATCQFTSECPLPPDSTTPETVCRAGVCTCECIDSRDCAHGLKCIANRCKVGSAEPCPGPICDLAGSTCLSLVDNSTATILDLRMSQFRATSPPAFATAVVQGNLFDTSTTLHYDDCFPQGTGLLTWLFQWDVDKGTLTFGAGGPIPTKDAAKQGACFVTLTDAPTKFKVEPKTTASTVGADGAFLAGPVDSMVLPIFQKEDGSAYILLPLHQIELDSLPGGGLSDDLGQPSARGNCIGRFDPAELDLSTDCKASIGPQSPWQNGASVVGLISLEEADSVYLPAQQQSLCVLVSGDPVKYRDPATGRCTRDADKKLLVRGDWDIATNAAGGAHDAWRFTGKLAASGIHIRGTSAKVDCADLPAAP